MILLAQEGEIQFSLFDRYVSDFLFNIIVDNLEISSWRLNTNWTRSWR